MSSKIKFFDVFPMSKKDHSNPLLSRVITPPPLPHGFIFDDIEISENEAKKVLASQLSGTKIVFYFDYHELKWEMPPQQTKLLELFKAYCKSNSIKYFAIQNSTLMNYHLETEDDYFTAYISNDCFYFGYYFEKNDVQFIRACQRINNLAEMTLPDAAKSLSGEINRLQSAMEEVMQSFSNDWDYILEYSKESRIKRNANFFIFEEPDEGMSIVYLDDTFQYCGFNYDDCTILIKKLFQNSYTYHNIFD